MTVVVIGVDPGDSTGLAVLVIEDKLPKLWHVFQGDPGDALTLAELTITHYYDGGERLNDVTLACERYVDMSTRGRTHQPTAQRVYGACEQLARRHEVRFVSQGPADAHAVAPNELLTRLGMLVAPETVKRPDADDANMAVRHTLLYLSHKHATAFHRLILRHGGTT